MSKSRSHVVFIWQIMLSSWVLCWTRSICVSKCSLFNGWKNSVIQLPVTSYWHYWPTFTPIGSWDLYLSLSNLQNKLDYYYQRNISWITPSMNVMDTTCTNGSVFKNVSMCHVLNIYMNVTCVLLTDHRLPDDEGELINIVLFYGR